MGGPPLPLVAQTIGDTMLQQRLFRLALEAIAITAVYEPGQGWRLMIATRHQAEDFDDAERSTYSHLSTDELIDVVLAELETRTRSI